MEDRSSSPPPFSIGDAYRLYRRSFGLLPLLGLGTILGTWTLAFLSRFPETGEVTAVGLTSTCSSSSMSISALARRFVYNIVPRSIPPRSAYRRPLRFYGTLTPRRTLDSLPVSDLRGETRERRIDRHRDEILTRWAHESNVGIERRLRK